MPVLATCLGWAVINKEPLALIEYWAVDPDYDDKVFRSVWQDYRGNTANDEDELRVVTQAVVATPHKAGLRKVCVRVVDVFGFEAEVVSTVGALWPRQRLPLLSRSYMTCVIFRKALGDFLLALPQ